MLDRLAALTHGLRVLVEPSLDGLENLFVLPPSDAAFLARWATLLDGAMLAGVGPGAAQCSARLFIRIVVGETLSGWTEVNILIRQVAKVSLDETPLGLVARGLRLWATWP